MARDDAGSGAQRPAKGRKVVAVGAAAVAAQRLQDFGDALGGVLRTIETRDALSDGIARRLHELWIEGDYVLEWQPTEIRCAGRSVLAAEAQAGRFILAAYSAGLRALAIRKDSVTADALRLCEHLAALQSGQLSVADFADWLWRGGALGFDVGQAESVAHIGDGLVSNVVDSKLWATRSQQAVERWNALAQVAAQALPAAALIERFRNPLQRLIDGAAQGQLSVTREEAELLHSAIDDAGALASCEIALIAQHPSMRQRLPAVHLTLRVAALIEASAQMDPGLFAQINAFDVGDQPLDRVLLGRAFGQRLLARGIESDVFFALMDQVDKQSLDGFFSVLIAQGEIEGGASLIVFTALLRYWGIERVFASIDPAQLGPRLAVGLVRHAFAQQPDSPALVAMIERLSVEAALHALLAVPELLNHAKALFRDLIAAHPQSSGPLLLPLVQAGLPTARCVGAALVVKLSVGFSDDALRASLSALVRTDLGEPFVLPLWEAKGASTQVRLCALTALAHDRALLAEALRRRPNTQADAPEIRQMLEELRWDKGV